MQIELAPEIGRQLRKALRDAGQREIGGMLMAEQLAAEHFRIVEFSVDDFSGSPTAFRRDPQLHLQTLNEFFDRTDRDFARFNYLGEWHSHPTFSVRPSAEDIQTMCDIVEDQSAGINFAALLIVRLRLRLWIDYSLTIFARQHTPRSALLSGLPLRQFLVHANPH